ncbi:DUF7577 domain-containing protein [Halorhabdus amylolytica]|uniref:DUF7577 domain-containing protein n=1 Tax=Halorhabdus amylolytica TaxID=2559573 RepID=UPI0010AA39E2|nr:hypothetical protein [Halorhabdus amylolytica]
MAPVWGWIAAYLLGFLLFQAVIYWYLQGDGTSFEEPTPGYTEGDVATHPAVDRPDRDGQGSDGTVPDGSVRCPYCGASNEREPNYTYCRECVRELR